MCITSTRFELAKRTLSTFTKNENLKKVTQVIEMIPLSTATNGSVIKDIVFFALEK